MYTRRFSVTLIECIVAFTLFALLASFLMGTLAYTSRAQVLFEKAEIAIEKEQVFFFHMQKNLDHMASKETSMKFVQKDNSPPILEIELMPPLDIDPDFTGEVTMRLLLKDNCYLMQLCSKTNPTKIKEIVLYEPVHQVNYAFLYYTNKEKPEILYSSPTLKKIPYGMMVAFDKNQSYSFYFPFDKVSLPLLALNEEEET